MAGHPEKLVSWSGASDSPPGEDIPPPKKFVQIAQLTNRIWHDIIKCSHAKTPARWRRSYCRNEPSFKY